MATDHTNADKAASMNEERAVETLRTAADRGVSTEFEAHVALLRELLGDELDHTETELPDHLQRSVYPLVETGRHLLEAGGKRIRPILTLLCAHAVGRAGPEARRLAAAGELVHLATLLHDDVIDDAELRRGRPTPRVVWSNTASVLGGDYALTRALDIVGSVPVDGPLREAIATLRELVEGEILQLGHRASLATTVQDYYALADRKTASLFRWCCRAGAHLGEDPTIVDAVGAYGGELGLCFQVVDDILDYSASAETSGKEPLADLAEGKPTLPLLLAMEADEGLRARIEEHFAAGTMPNSADVIASLEASEALTKARILARGHAERAIEALAPMPDSPYRHALVHIATSLAARIA